MGYYTNYTLEVQAGKMYNTGLMTKIKEALQEISGYSSWYHQDDTLSLSEAKWYDHQQDMWTLSKLFPDVKFEVHCQGEDGEQWMIYALNGKTERCGSEVVFTPRTLW